MEDDKNVKLAERLLVFMALLAFAAFCAFTFIGCETQKKAAITKEEKTSITLKSEEATKLTTDLTKTTRETTGLQYEPADPTKPMSFVNRNGDTITALNTKIKELTEKSTQENNIVTDERYQKLQEEIELLKAKLKESEKEKGFQVEALLYGALGLGILLIIILVFFGIMINKNTKVSRELLSKITT